MLSFFFQEETRSLGNLGAGSPIQKKEKVQLIIARSFYGAARSITDHSFTGTQRLQKRQVTKVLLDGLYDQDSKFCHNKITCCLQHEMDETQEKA